MRQEPLLDAPPHTRERATGDPTRAWWRVQPRLLTQNVVNSYNQQGAHSQATYPVRVIVNGVDYSEDTSASISSHFTLTGATIGLRKLTYGD